MFRKNVRLTRSPFEPDRQASLDHVVYWYSTTFKTSDWLLHVISAPRTADGRGVVEGKFYTVEGELIAVTMQEGVVRAAPGWTPKGDAKL